MQSKMALNLLRENDMRLSVSVSGWSRSSAKGLHTQIAPGESKSSRSIERECRQDHHCCTKETTRKTQDTGTEWLRGTGFFRFPSVPRAVPGPQSYINKKCHARAGLQVVPTNLKAQVRPPHHFKFLAQEGPTQSHQDTGTKEQLGPGDFCFLYAPMLCWQDVGG